MSLGRMFFRRSSITCMPAFFARLDSLRVNSRNRAVPLKAHAENLGQAVHAVGGVHTGTGTAARADLALVLFQLFRIDFTCGVLSYCLEHAGKASLSALHMAGQHRAAADKYSWDIQTGCCHQKTRDVLVTVRNHNQSIKLMSHCHSLCGIGDQISRNQRIFHAHMAHGDTVTDGDGREYYSVLRLPWPRPFLQPPRSCPDSCGRERSHYRNLQYQPGDAPSLPSVKPRALKRERCGACCTPFFTASLLIISHSFYSLYWILSAIRSPIFTVPTRVHPSDMISPVR